MTPDQTYQQFLLNSGAIAQLVVLSMLLERALALVFEYHWFIKLSERIEGLKVPIAFLASWYTCAFVNFDILGVIFSRPGVPPEVRPIGILITSAVVAGGSAGAMTLFQGFLNFNRETQTSLIESKKIGAEASVSEAKSRKEKAEAEAAEAKSRKEKAEAEAAEAKSRKEMAEAAEAKSRKEKTEAEAAEAIAKKKKG